MCGFLAKIKLNAKVINQSEKNTFSYHGDGLLLKNKIVYYENDICVTLMKQENIVKLVRKHKEYELEMTFRKGYQTEVVHNSLKESLKTYLQVETNVLEWENDRVRIDYRLYPTNELFSYQLKFEVIE